MKKLDIDPATQRRPSSRKQQRNAKIRESLNQKVEVQVIPALEDMEGYEKRKPRVCAYYRVSTDLDTQALSYELQVQNYTEYIESNPEWEFAGIYADEYTSYGQNPKRPWIPTISVFTGVFIIQSLLTLPT